MKFQRVERKIVIAVSVLFFLVAVGLIFFFALRNTEEEAPTVYTYGDFEYIILENGRLEITDYLGDSSEISIPDAINGRSVYSIGESAFSGLSLEKVYIGGFCEVISSRAFYGCTSLSEVEMPRYLVSIGDSAFSGCAFKQIFLAETLTSIGDNAFFDCTNLEKAIIPNSVKTVGKSAFAGCVALSEA
jgi:hypothetical protein